MKWRAFQEFEESRVRAEMKDRKADIEIATELSARYLETLRNIVGCFAYTAMHRDARSTEIQEFIEHLSEAYAAVDVLAQIGGATWHHLPSTAKWLYTVQQRVRHVIRVAPSAARQMTTLDWKLLTIEVRHLWHVVQEARRRVVPHIIADHIC